MHGGDVVDAVHIGRMAHQVDSDDAARAARDRVFNPRGVDAPSLGINIDTIRNLPRL